eukprot:767327-Hanusia_phi.AAC.1
MDLDAEDDVSLLEAEISAMKSRLEQLEHEKEKLAITRTVNTNNNAAFAQYHGSLSKQILQRFDCCASSETTMKEYLNVMLKQIMEEREYAKQVDAADGDLKVMMSRNDAFLDTLEEAISLITDQDDKTSRKSFSCLEQLRKEAAYELARLQDCFVNAEIQKTDALIDLQQSLTLERVLNEQIKKISSGELALEVPQNASVEQAVVSKQNTINSLNREAESLRSEVEQSLLNELKNSQGMSIREGDAEVRLEQSKENVMFLQRISNIAKMHMYCLELLRVMMQQRCEQQDKSLGSLQTVLQVLEVLSGLLLNADSVFKFDDCVHDSPSHSKPDNSVILSQHMSLKKKIDSLEHGETESLKFFSGQARASEIRLEAFKSLVWEAKETRKTPESSFVFVEDAMAELEKVSKALRCFV